MPAIAPAPASAIKNSRREPIGWSIDLPQFGHRAIQAAAELQIAPMKFGLEHLRDFVPGFLLHNHAVNSIVESHRIIAEFPHLFFVGYGAVAGNDHVEVE